METRPYSPRPGAPRRALLWWGTFLASLLAIFPQPAWGLCDHGPPASLALPPVPLPRQKDAIWFSARTMTQHLATGVLTASGSVRATLGPLVLEGDRMVYDRQHGTGHLAGHVMLLASPYVILARRLDFNVKARSLRVQDFHGQISGRANFWGSSLLVSRTRIVGQQIGYSACLCPDPGYYLSAGRFTFLPRKRHGNNLITHDTALHLGGLTVLMLPYFATRLGSKGHLIPPFPLTFSLPGNGHFDSTAGYDAYQGPWAQGTINYSLAPNDTFSAPLHFSLTQGLSVAAHQQLTEGPYSIQNMIGWANPWAPRQGGPTAGITVSRPIGGTLVSAALGYRTQFFTGAVNQVPHVSASFPTLHLASLSLSPSLDVGYFQEELSPTANTSAMRTSETLNANLPTWSPVSWWNGSIYGSETGEIYPGTGKSQEGLSTGITQNQTIGPLRTYFGVSSSLRWGLSPFGFDFISPNGFLSMGGFWQLTQTWGIGSEVQYIRLLNLQNQPESNFILSNLSVTLAYRANCLSWALHVQPFLHGISLDYNVTTF